MSPFNHLRESLILASGGGVGFVSLILEAINDA